MRTIFTLPEHVISQIAAGEVIERPVYAVKELLENALDAKATSISIHIEDSGLKKIIIADNGDGMSEEDVLESYKPHTTSKIIEDLIGIKTLGFRGEALSSIAAISDMTIQSRVKGRASGFQVRLKAGVFQDSGPVGMPYGTVITITNLFYTVPARKKFLKTKRTEFRHIVDLVTQYALVYPDIRFQLTHNKRTVFDLLGNQELSERIEHVLGKSFSSQLLSITPDSEYVQLEGFIARPQISSKTLTKQFLFVNKRAVVDKVVSTAVKESFGTLLDRTQYPAFILFITLPHEVVDVNVHPRKEQISFIQQSLVFDTVKKTVSKTLSDNNLTFFNASFSQFAPRAGTTSSHAAQVLRDQVDTWSVKDVSTIVKTSDVYQLHNTYLVVHTKQGFLLVDQHGAHERVLYEQYLAEFKKQKKTSKAFKLKKPIAIELNSSEYELFEEYKNVFKEFGFIVLSHKKSIEVTHVPELFKDRNITSLFHEILEQLGEGREVDIDSFSLMMIAFLSCRAAVMAGEKLTQREAKKLIDKLEKTKNNATCPHGRPTKIEISIHELHKMFKRE